jgi:hypothetical protein
MRALCFSDFVDMRDVGMIEFGCGFRFLNEAAHSILI